MADFNRIRRVGCSAGCLTGISERRRLHKGCHTVSGGSLPGDCPRSILVWGARDYSCYFTTDSDGNMWVLGLLGRRGLSLSPPCSLWTHTASIAWISPKVYLFCMSIIVGRARCVVIRWEDGQVLCTRWKQQACDLDCDKKGRCGAERAYS